MRKDKRLEQDQELTRQSGEGFSSAARSGGEGALEVRRADSDTAAGEKTSRAVAGRTGLALAEAIDQETTVVDMNVPGMPGYRPGREARPLAGEPLSKRDTARYIATATLTGLGVALLFALALVLFVLFCQFVWLRP